MTHPAQLTDPAAGNARITLEIPWTPYNARRYRAPWAARVTFGDDAKASFEFIGVWEAGTLVIPNVEQGEVVAVGQMDMRRPDRSYHRFAIVEPGASMRGSDYVGGKIAGLREVTRTQARHWLADSAPSKPSLEHVSSEDLLDELRRRGDS